MRLVIPLLILLATPAQAETQTPDALLKGLRTQVTTAFVEAQAGESKRIEGLERGKPGVERRKAQRASNQHFNRMDAAVDQVRRGLMELSLRLVTESRVSAAEKVEHIRTRLEGINRGVFTGLERQPSVRLAVVKAQLEDLRI